MGIAASLITLKLHGERSTCRMCYAKEGNDCFHDVQRAQQRESGHFIVTDFGIAKSATGQRSRSPADLASVITAPSTLGISRSRPTRLA
jgi:hypothetical protein